MSNTAIDQHSKGQQRGQSRMQNGFEQRNQTGQGNELDSTYMHPNNLNPPYGMAPTTESYIPSYYGQMPFPYVGGGSEWSTGGDSVSYLASYGGETQQPNYIPDAMFGQPPGPSPAYYNPSYSYFQPSNEFSAWSTSGGAPGAAMPESPGTAFSQQSAAPTAYNGDYYHSILPATPHDYLGTGEVLPSGTGNILGQSAAVAPIPQVRGNTVMSGGDVISKISSGPTSNGMKLVERGIQNLGLGDSMKPVQQISSLPMASGNFGNADSSQTVIIPGTTRSAPLGQNGSNNSSSNSLPGSNAPKPVSWAAIASKPAKPQPKPKVKANMGQGLPLPAKSMDIGVYGETTPPPPAKGQFRGMLPGQGNPPQRWSAPRQGGSNQSYGISSNGQTSDYSSQGVYGSDSGNRTDVVHSNVDEVGSAILEKLKSENDYNPKRLTLDVRNARFFVIKSYSEDDIHRSIKYNIWCSTEHGNKRLDAAFREQQGRGPVILLYSVNGSGHFCGVAEMLTQIDYTKRAGVWAQDKWKGKFQVKWIYAKDVPNSALRHIRLENNENKPVTNSRDTQEVPADKGRQVLKIISQFKHQTSIFDDFLHYERRQQEEEGQRAKRNEQRSRDNMRRGDRQTSQLREQE